MAKRLAKHCAHCKRELTVEEERSNGQLENLRIKIQTKIAEPDFLKFHQICFVSQYFCSDCWKEFENIYKEFTK